MVMKTRFQKMTEQAPSSAERRLRSTTRLTCTCWVAAAAFTFLQRAATAMRRRTHCGCCRMQRTGGGVCMQRRRQQTCRSRGGVSPTTRWMSGDSAIRRPWSAEVLKVGRFILVGNSNSAALSDRHARLSPCPSTTVGDQCGRQQKLRSRARRAQASTAARDQSQSRRAKHARGCESRSRALRCRLGPTRQRSAHRQRCEHQRRRTTRQRRPACELCWRSPSQASACETASSLARGVGLHTRRRPKAHARCTRCGTLLPPPAA